MMTELFYNMKSKLGFLLSGAILGFTSHQALNLYSPSRDLSPTSRSLINNYIAQNNLSQSSMLYTIMKSLNLFWKGFYNYGIDHKLQGFYFHESYIEQDQEDIKTIYCIFSPTDYICGHPQIQHGGVTATIIDHNMGYLATLFTHQVVATTQLNITYKKPVKKGQLYVLKAEIAKRQNRMIFMNGTIKDIETGEVKAESNGTFKTVDWNHKKGRIIRNIARQFYPKKTAEI